MVVIAVVAAGIVVWRSTREAGAHVDATIGTPHDLLVSFSLRQRPVPGWRLNAADIGLPPDVPVGTLFASTADSAYFITTHRDEQGLSPVGWLYGVETSTGKVLFPPIELAGFRGYPHGECYGNGPGVALCVTGGDVDRGLPKLAWVVDLGSGQVTYTGQTDLNVQGDRGTARQSLMAVGSYRAETRLVVAREGVGVYGVGPHAEQTWFVPGGGNIFDPGYRQSSDIPATTIAMQNAARDAPPESPYRMFSVIDGTDLTPTPPEGTRIRKSLVYNGGFAYSFREPGKRDGLLFYNTAGEFVARYQDENHDLTPIENSVMPMALLRANPAQWLVLSAAGELVQSIPTTAAGVYFRIIGTKFYLNQPGTDDRWQQWDLNTGASGPVCQLGLSYDYVGSDGSIVVVNGGLQSSTVRAVDPSTCATAWEITEQESGRQLRLQQVGTELIQSTRDELTQLRPAQ
ncbi:hypothetical protein O6P37_15845 [Mycobacterium sp. CPCC 205372]|uniref:Uncharacterized protein n=1 Tax=Mycobacterium hippophais TaxID=3016340 RepID=A0ABT4PUU1_9MYCO|nr:hypothetical protein [Mycobacterium hippophais]MCZ8380342.1 hypothetical protein [Mycobacterium hippophais]